MSDRRIGSLSLGARVLLRQIAAAPGSALIIFLTTLLAALVVGGAPRLLERVSEQDLREVMTEAQPEQRNIRLESIEHIGAGFEGDAFSEVRRRGEDLLTEGFPASVARIVTASQYLWETPRFRVTSFPEERGGSFPTMFTLRYQEGVDDKLTLVAGSMPGIREPIPMLLGTQCPADRLAIEDFLESPDSDCSVHHVPFFETVVTAETAEAMMLEVGDRVFLRPDAQDRLWSILGGPPEDQTYLLSISGIVELTDPEEEYWYADPSLHRADIFENPDFRLIFATGLMNPDSYDEMTAVLPVFGFRYTWRFFVDPDLVEGSEAATLRADLGRILPSNDESVITFLPELIAEYLEQRALTVGLMSTAVTGLLVAALGVVLVLAGLIADRQAAHTVLTRDRGASRGQLTLSAVYTGLLLVVPAALLGHLATAAALPGGDGMIPRRGAAVLALGGTMAVVTAGSPYVFRRLGALQRLDSRPEGSSGRRLVVELFVLTAAAGSVALLRRRGLADSTGGAAIEFDLLLAMAPAVIGLAAGLVVLRLMVPLMRLSSRLGAQGRSLVPFVGLRRLVAQPSAAHAPLVVVLLAVAVAVFSSVVRDAIAEGQASHTWQVVGADFRVEAHDTGVPIPTSIEPASLAGDDVWAEGVLLPDTTVFGPARSSSVSVLAIDAPAYQEVLAGSGSEVPELGQLGKGGDGSAPVLVSSSWGGGEAPQVGVEFNLEMGLVDPRVTAAAVVDRFPGLPYPEPFVVMSLHELRRAWGDVPVPATVLYLRATESETGRLAETVAAAGQLTRLVSRYEVRAALAGDPFALWVDRGLSVVFYMSLGFAVIAALSLLIVSAGRRRRDLGFLRVVGLKPGQATMITALEQIPSVVIATAIGTATGGIVAGLLAPALDIESFTGRLLPTEIVVDPLGIAVLTLVMVVVLGAAVVSFVVATRQEDYGMLLRVGDER